MSSGRYAGSDYIGQSRCRSPPRCRHAAAHHRVRRHRHDLDGLRRAGADPNPGSGYFVPDALIAIHARVQPKLGGSRILTGPVAVRGARAGQVLEVRIRSIGLNYRH
jgi:hypothetical protein